MQGAACSLNSTNELAPNAYHTVDYTTATSALIIRCMSRRSWERHSLQDVVQMCANAVANKAAADYNNAPFEGEDAIRAVTQEILFNADA
ncbi:Uu.00g145110.m01.CDS01 [Anthostomella pinea]|uniref:Uu.00g145110.m01.CDS01 n=1 Tax=Anthostomella pinea TaxID=933095 RepID=A0AAI8YLY7_9PEZI|nr:Uu.00g145110.m01.CDS01 [Anthostomella pinea]